MQKVNQEMELCDEVSCVTTGKEMADVGHNVITVREGGRGGTIVRLHGVNLTHFPLDGTNQIQGSPGWSDGKLGNLEKP